MLGTTVIITLEIFLSYFLLFTVHHPPRSVNAPLSRRTNGDCFPRGRRASHRHHLEPAELFLVALVFPSLGLELPIQVTARNLSICGQLQHLLFHSPSHWVRVLCRWLLDLAFALAESAYPVRFPLTLFRRDSTGSPLFRLPRCDMRLFAQLFDSPLERLRSLDT